MNRYSEATRIQSGDESGKKVAAFLVLTLILALPFYYLILSAGTLDARDGLYVLGLMWAPGLAALLTRLVFQRNLRGMGWGWGATGYQAASYLIPVAACLVVYGLTWSTGLGGFAADRLDQGSVLLTARALAMVATLGVFQAAIPGLGEELGWRGFLVPELAKSMSYAKVSIFCAVVWSVYHYPMLLYADYSSGAPIGYAILMFTVGITGATFIATWLRLKSGSLWTGVLLHASHNLFVQGVFDGLTVDRGITGYVTTEFGAGLAVVYAAGAYWCWRHRRSLPDATM